MENLEIDMDYYRLEAFAAFRKKDVNDLLDYADMGFLKIHILVLSHNNKTSSPYKPFPLSSYHARQAIESPAQFLLSHSHLSLPNGRITLVIIHKEKEKFDEYLISLRDGHELQPENQVKETDAQIVRRLTTEGVDIQTSDDTELKKSIAKELKAAFPMITYHRIGKLLTPDDGVTPSAFRKRGRKLSD